MKKAKNIKKSTRAVALVLAASMLVGALQTFAYALPEEELLPYLIEFSDMQSANEFEAEVGENAEILNGTIVKAELGQIRAESLERSAQVNYIEEDYIVRANEEEAPSEAEPELTEMLAWSSKAVGAEYSLAQGETGSGVKIAVLDSGLDVYSEVRAYGGIDLEDPEYCCGDDLTGHGTVVSGIIAAPADEAGIVGIAPEAEIYVVRVLDSANEAPISRIIEGIDWCMENDIDIINMSFGTENYSQAFEAKIAEAAQAGLLLVSSAGNGESVEYPAKFDEVIAVGAVGSDMTVSDNSATGSELEFAAPGENVYSTSLIGGYAAASGTSIAAPHVAGAAAVILGKDRTKSAEFVRALLAASAKPLGSAASCGNGIPDLEYALQIYDDFAANYADASYIPPANSGNAATYENEDVFVVGQWSTEGHNGLAEQLSGFNSIKIKLIKNVSANCDSRKYLNGHALNPNGSPYQGSYSYHGTENYVAAARYLYTLARHYEYGLKFKEGIEEKYKSLLGKTNFANIVSDIDYMSDYYYLDYRAYFTSNNKYKAIIVFGMLFHLLGDIYAHRSIVPPSSIEYENRTSYGNGVGGNEGLYFVVSDFVDDCGCHIKPPTTHIETNVVYREVTNDDISSALKTALLSLGTVDFEYNALRLVVLFVCRMFGLKISEDFNSNKVSYLDQKNADIELLNYAIDIPHKYKSLCDSSSYPCYGALKRIAGLGVLQFKDIKYFLTDYHIYNTEGTKTTSYDESQKYYEDRGMPYGNQNTIKNCFYYRRYKISETVVSNFFEDFSNNSAFDPANFFPIYDSKNYMESPENYRTHHKIDKLYNYLKSTNSALDTSTNAILTSGNWANLPYELFNFTTIACDYVSGNETLEMYFVDPTTYKSGDKPSCYSYKFPTGTGWSANSFYYGGSGWNAAN